MSQIAENYLRIREEVRKACESGGFAPDHATLIAVSKTRTVEEILEAYEAGARDFGENKVQELLEKIPQLPADIRWHMIGHLQTNKVRKIVGKVALIHSVDTEHLAREISRISQEEGLVSDVLAEVNLGEEESKFGLTGEGAMAFARETALLPGIRLKGLMTVAPYVPDPEENRELFRKLRQISIDISSQNIDNSSGEKIRADILSMGMSGDYRVAAQEGAVYVRVGTGIFGERDYSKHGYNG
ncbi:MAG: YggS family pyridoxal phosphate-dependent enzyme [Lachnospiraceae bacterium]|nr:YggS family pyridoxal phosphate-dependent enzyme [Lachnospiraceae bacterium]